jgi:hypothetical protein
LSQLTQLFVCAHVFATHGRVPGDERHVTVRFEHTGELLEHVSHLRAPAPDRLARRQSFEMPPRTDLVLSETNRFRASESAQRDGSGNRRRRHRAVS